MMKIDALVYELYVLIEEGTRFVEDGIEAERG